MSTRVGWPTESNIPQEQLNNNNDNNSDNNTVCIHIPTRQHRGIR